MSNPKPTVILVMDGFGVCEASEGNAISIAQKPVFENLLSYYPYSTVQASGELVGLPWGEVGNSEVGHLNIGAGRVMYQDLPRINKAVADNSFFVNPQLLGAMEHVRKNNSSLHIMGLLSTGGVHSHINHALALLQLAKKSKVKNVFLHAFMDGRDVPPQSGLDFINETQKVMKELKVGEIASMSGRYYAMDRDENWDRMEQAYNAIVKGSGEKADDPVKVLQTSYANGLTDEQIVPVTITKRGKPVSLLKDGDAMIHFDYRSDRARFFTQIFANPDFNAFDRGTSFNNSKIVTLTDYSVGYPVDISFPAETVNNSLGEVVSNKNLKQLRIAETEKYAHVSMFFNCGRMDPFAGEERLLIQSPAVKSYDLQPEMSANEVTDKFLEKIAGYDFSVINFANPDMVGHTGNIMATAKGIEAMDKNIGRIVEKILSLDGQLIITADHGNADVMKNLQTGEIVKDHTVNPVPVILVANNLKKETSTNTKYQDLYLTPPVGVLADITVTTLNMMDIERPAEMSGVSLRDII